jgi:hypothetical protein
VHPLERLAAVLGVDLVDATVVVNTSGHCGCRTPAAPR